MNSYLVSLSCPPSRSNNAPPLLPDRESRPTSEDYILLQESQGLPRMLFSFPWVLSRLLVPTCGGEEALTRTLCSSER